MSSRPLVSVLLPYRDAASTLDEAIASVLAQEDVELELVAVDDRSRDDGPARVAAWATRDARVRAVQSEGEGIVAALQTAVRHAEGPVLGRIDADDVALPQRLARQLVLLASDERLGAVGTLVEAFVTGGSVGAGLERYVAWQNSLVTPEEHARDRFVESPLCQPSMVLRRSAFDAVGGYRHTTWPEDYDLLLRLSAAGFTLAKVPEVLLRWRHHPERATCRDPRCAPARIVEAKAHYLAPELTARGRPVVVWGAGQTGKRFARALEAHGVVIERFVDIDPRKIGRVARGRPVVAPAALPPAAFVVVALGAPGARVVVRARLLAMGRVELRDFVCVA